MLDFVPVVRVLRTPWVLLALGCGARSGLDFGDLAEHEPTVPESGGTAGSHTGVPPVDVPPIDDMYNPAEKCNFDGQRTTRSGPCEASGFECGSDAGRDCGRCQEDELCVENRCYVTHGAPPVSAPPLMRGLYDDEEGQSIVIRRDGVVEGLVAALWTSGLDLEANLYVECDGESRPARSIPIPADRVPSYSGIHSSMNPVEISVEPPLRVRRDETVLVMFRTPGTSDPFLASVSGIYMENVDPYSRFISREWRGIGSDVNWDYMVTVLVH
jgi:hypothetical protein